MNDLTPSYEPEAGQVILEGHPAGAAGEVGLVPVPGVDLAFDRADGQLSRVVIDVDGSHGSTEHAAAMLVRLFGPEVLTVVSAAATGSSQGRALSPERGLCDALSRLARLDAARATSPVARSSPWWAAEAAKVAGQACLPARARTEARRAVRGLTKALEGRTLPREASLVALAVADIVAADEPEAARQLRESIGGPREQPVGQPRSLELDVAAEVESLEKDQASLAGLQWMLDPGLVPDGLFRPGLSPHSDLLVRHEGAQARVVVEALLGPGVKPDMLDGCQARLVDPAVRRVLAQASFVPAGTTMRPESRISAEFQARAEILLPFPMDELPETWLEAVQGRARPVYSTKRHRIRRALRWADAALRAERCPAGLAPHSTREDWAALAFMAWERCRRDWECAGDADRAFLAARRMAALDPGSWVSEAPSAMVAGLTDRVPVPGPACLAEAVGF